MKITNWKGLAPQSTFERHSDGFFNDRYRNLLSIHGDFTLAVNVRERPESYSIEVAVPGPHPDSVNALCFPRKYLPARLAGGQ